MQKTLDSRIEKRPRTETICDLIRMILTMNSFIFNDEHFIQNNGTAMGTKMAPAFANLFMGDFERKALDNSPDKPYLWWRCIDDIFLIWTLGEEKLDKFITNLNSLHPTIKFTSERSTTSIPFVDVNIQINNGKLEIDPYCKPTDKRQYLLHSSSHPYHTKKSIPYSLALRLRRICSTEIALQKRFEELQHYLAKRGYKERFVKQQIDRTRQIPPEQALQENKRDNKCDRVLFVITYN